MVQNKNILFKKEYAAQLFVIAQGDLLSAEALMNSANPGRVENILYMIQQSVEKAVKSVLIVKQISFPMVYDLGILVALLPSSEYPPGGFDLASLNPYASIRRYEAGAIPITNDEIQASFKAAQLVMDWAKSYGL